MISVLMCAFTSLYAGLAIFSVVGFMSHQLDTPIDKVITSGQWDLIRHKILLSSINITEIFEKLK